MDLRPRLLWVDCIAGAIVGLGMLLFRGWLHEFYRLPLDLLLFMGVTNLGYAAFSFSLALRPWRSLALIRLLVIANLLWAVVCVGLALAFREVASPFGLAQLWVEALFVGGLGYLEWRWREWLQGSQA